MLGEKYLIKLDIDDKSRELKFNFRFLKNLYSFLEQTESKEKNPLIFINNFIKDEDKNKYYADILYCMCNGDISLIDLNSVIENVDGQELLLNLYSLIVTEWKIEDVFENETDNTEEDIEEINEDNNEEIKNDNEFIRFWDMNYYTALYQLHMTEKAFLDSSPREIITLNKLNVEYHKNIILQRDVAIQRAKNKANEGADNSNNGETNKVIRCKRLKDIF